MATVPSEMTFSAGSVLTAAQLNTNVRDAINFVIAPPIASLYMTGTQSVPNAAFTPVGFDAESIDRDGGHSNITNNSRFTAQTAGWYTFIGTISYGSNSTGLRIATFFRNGVDLGRAQQLPTVTTGGSAAVETSSGLEYLAVGDYLELVAYQTSGGALLVGGCHFQVLWSSS